MWSGNEASGCGQYRVQEAVWSTGGLGWEGVGISKPGGRLGAVARASVQEAVVLVAAAAEERLVRMQSLGPQEWGHVGTGVRG